MRRSDETYHRQGHRIELSKLPGLTGWAVAVWWNGAEPSEEGGYCTFTVTKTGARVWAWFVIRQFGDPA